MIAYHRAQFQGRGRVRSALLFLLAVLTLALNASAAAPEKVEKVPPGMGKYLIVLWEPGTPVPGEKGKFMKRVPEPDVKDLGGQLLSTHANKRVVYLPLGRAKTLRRNEAVAYIQRIWTGESLQGWDETDALLGEELTELSEPDTLPEIDLLWEKAYQYDGDGNIKAIGGDHYVYDGVGRLTEATVNGQMETYRYDSFGNLIEKSVAGQPPVAIAVDSSSNRLSGVSYDAAGNVVSRTDRGVYVYDSLNMITAYKAPPRIEERRILYDANDERIGTMHGSNQQRWTLRDFEGQVLREFSGSESEFGMIWTWRQDHIRGEGQLLAGEMQEWWYTGSGAFKYGGKRHYHLDHLGSVRVVTNAQGRSISEHEYFPFGTTQTKTYQEQLNWGDPHMDGMRFAGHWRDFMDHVDVESNEYLDYMHARYYDPNVGRFLSVDPVLDVKAAMANPQRWHRYSYVSNNPINKVDPDGRYEQDVHQGLTYVLARAAGFSGAQASTIANANQGVDEDPATQPFVSISARDQYHFTTGGRRDQMWGDFAATGSLSSLGQFFHAQQDSFSHAGFGKVFGHVFAGHGPDKTPNDAAKAMTMAADTYNKLNSAADKLGISRGDRVAWKEIRTAIVVFSIARTQTQKDAAIKDLRDTIEAARQRNQDR